MARGAGAQCPTCSRPLTGATEELPYRPFCSERCRLIDLGKWLDAAYRIGAPVEEEDLDEGLPTEGGAGTEPPPSEHLMKRSVKRPIN